MRKVSNTKPGKVLIYFLLFFVTYYAMYFLVAMIILIDTGTKLDTTIYQRQSLTFIDDTDLNYIYDEFGEENVTRLNRYLDQVAQYAYFVDSSFINTGVTAYNVTYERDIVEEIELLEGEVWEKGSTDKVIIIDQRTAEWLNIGVGDEYEIFVNSSDYYEVVGIVSNTSLPGSERGYQSPHFGFASEQGELPKTIYLPYELSKTAFEYDYEDVDTLLVKSSSFTQVKSDTDQLGNYLEEKHTSLDDDGDTVKSWVYYYRSVINIHTILEEETNNQGFVIFTVVAYGLGIVVFQLGKREYRKYKEKKYI